VEHIVDEIPPERVHVSGCMIDRVYKALINSKKIEFIKLKAEKKVEKVESKDAVKKEPEKPEKPKNDQKDIKRNRIVSRAIEEFKNGMYCNIGIGIPGLAVSAAAGKIDVNL